MDMLKGLLSSGAVGAGVGALGMGAATALGPDTDPEHPEDIKNKQVLKSMLKGLSSGAAGAGVGGLGMGTATALGPDTDPEHLGDTKSKRVLKSMLLGGALGGLVGAGGRAAWNAYDPSMVRNQGTGISEATKKISDLFSGKPEKPTDSTGPGVFHVVGNYPGITALAGGTGAGLASAALQSGGGAPNHLMRNDPLVYQYNSATGKLSPHTPTFSEKLIKMFDRSKPNPSNLSQRTSSGFERLFNVPQGIPGTQMNRIERFMKSPLTHPVTHGAAATVPLLVINNLIRSRMLNENTANEILERQLAQNPVQ